MIPAVQISVWLCLGIESLSKAEGPAAGLAHPPATPSCTKRALHQMLPLIKLLRHLEEHTA